MAIISSSPRSGGTPQSNTVTLTARSVSETVNIGARLASYLKRGDVVLLYGDLGAGKTHFTKGIAAGLGIDGYVVSPTFTIVNEYRSGSLPLFHMDVYRLAEFDELIEIGFFDYLAEGVTVIEWADRFEELARLPERTFSVKIEKPEGAEDVRSIEITLPEGAAPLRAKEEKC